jgi:hypothetical protein
VAIVTDVSRVLRRNQTTQKTQMARDFAWSGRHKVKRCRPFLLASGLGLYDYLWLLYAGAADRPPQDL